MALTGVLMYVLAPWMMSLLTPDERVRELGVAVLRIEAYAEPLYGASIVATGVLRGAGDTLVPSILNLVSLWGVRIPLSMLLAGDYGLRGVWMAMAAELCVRGMLYIVRCVVKMRKEALIRDV
jgi:Na+-driven multidrug efflux pump